MKVASPAGDFEIQIKGATVESDTIVIKGQMGVWDSTIHIQPDEIWGILVLMFRPSIMLLLLKMSIRSLYNKLFGIGNEK